jgi:hypothetical protein
MISPDSASAGTVPVPMAALALDGVAPGPGDSVSFTVSGRIVSAEGETARVQVETINDQPVAADAGAEDRAMMDAAEAADREAGAAY